VIHLDPWWNPAVEDQASNRHHRIGQQRPVTIYRLVTQDTIEEKILVPHKEKRDLADSFLNGGNMAARLDTAALLQLLEDNVWVVRLFVQLVYVQLMTAPPLS
jgi:SNF2 family DNA or RNA helicase